MPIRSNVPAASTHSAWRSRLLWWMVSCSAEKWDDVALWMDGGKVMVVQGVSELRRAA